MCAAGPAKNCRRSMMGTDIAVTRRHKDLRYLICNHYIRCLFMYRKPPLIESIACAFVSNVVLFGLGVFTTWLMAAIAFGAVLAAGSVILAIESRSAS